MFRGSRRPADLCCLPSRWEWNLETIPLETTSASNSRPMESTGRQTEVKFGRDRRLPTAGGCANRRYFPGVCGRVSTNLRETTMARAESERIAAAPNPELSALRRTHFRSAAWLHDIPVGRISSLIWRGFHRFTPAGAGSLPAPLCVCCDFLSWWNLRMSQFEVRASLPAGKRRYPKVATTFVAEHPGGGMMESQTEPKKHSRDDCPACGERLTRSLIRGGLPSSPRPTACFVAYGFQEEDSTGTFRCFVSPFGYLPSPWLSAITGMNPNDGENYP